MNLAKDRKALQQYWWLVLAFLTAIALPLSTALQNATLPLIVCSVILCKELRAKLPQIIKEPLVIVGLVFYTLFLVGSLWSSGSTQDISKMLLKMIGLVELPFIIAFFSSDAKRKSALWGFGVGIALTIFFSYLSIWTNHPMFHAKTWGLQYGIFRMHMYHSYFLALFACWLLYLQLNKQIKPKWLKIVAWVSIFVLLHNIYYETWSRTGQILCLLMVISIFIQWRLKIGLIVSAVILFVITPTLIYTSSSVQAKIKTYQENVQQYKAGKFDPQNPSMYLRWTFHKYAKEIIAEKPIIGHGTGSYPSEYARLSARDHNPFGNSQPHSDYLWFGAELGYIGMITFIIFLTTLFIRSFSLARPYRDFGVTVALVYAAACYENGYISDSVSGLAFFALVGLLFATRYDLKKHVD